MERNKNQNCNITLVRMATVKKSTNNKCVETMETTLHSLLPYNHYGEQYEDSLKRQGIKLQHDSTIPLLGIYPEKTIIQEGPCTPLFIAALFIGRTWKQSQCP